MSPEAAQVFLDIRCSLQLWAKPVLWEWMPWALALG